MIFFAISQLLCVAIFFAYLAHHDREQRAERRELAQRIQAPEIAVAQAIPETPGERAYVLYDDDEDLAKELKALDGDG